MTENKCEECKNFEAKPKEREKERIRCPFCASVDGGLTATHYNGGTLYRYGCFYCDSRGRSNRDPDFATMNWKLVSEAAYGKEAK